MLRILRTVPFFVPAYSYGGPVVHTYNISRIQASLGYDVRVFTSNILTHDIISNTLPKYEELENIKIHRFPIKYRLGESHYFIPPKLPFNFFKYDYDIIHSHSYRTFYTDVATIISKIKKKPFVFTTHGTLRDMTLIDLSKDKIKEAKRMKLHDLMLHKFFTNTVDRIIVHSDYEKIWTIRNNVPEEKIRVIPHGVNVEKFSNGIYRERFIKKYKVKNKILLYVGRLLKNYRNLDYLILVMNDILKEYKNVKLWFVGHSFDKSYEKDLRKLIKKRNLTEHVRFITKPTREDIIGAYQAANIVVFPIRNSDSFGLPLLEAGAAKCPIISTNIGPAPELIINGKTGFLTDINSLSQLKNNILKILTDDELEKRMGLYGYEHILNNYSWQIVTDKTNQVYQELL